MWKISGIFTAPGVCIYIDMTYADGKYMRMPYLCRYHAYGYAWHLHVSLFFAPGSENYQSQNSTGV
ncbi:hypothetical protein FYK20_26140 (plasmid) [Escherichia albertii]|nr:hypothetical protein FYK20_26140 [Escherichia albertii]